MAGRWDALQALGLARPRQLDLPVRRNLGEGDLALRVESHRNVYQVRVFAGHLSGH
jgi:hypothetical protein